LITSLNIPKLLATVGTFTNAASIHLFSLFAALKIFSSIGTILISTFDISSGNFFQLTNPFFIILEENFFNSFGISISPKNHIFTFLNS
jgi:hypothetical protein